MQIYITIIHWEEWRTLKHSPKVLLKEKPFVILRLTTLLNKCQHSEDRGQSALKRRKISFVRTGRNSKQARLWEFKMLEVFSEKPPMMTYATHQNSLLRVIYQNFATKYLGLTSQQIEGRDVFSVLKLWRDAMPYQGFKEVRVKISIFFW